MTEARPDRDTRALAAAVAETLARSAPGAAFDATIGVAAATALAPSATAPAVGPRTVDARTLPRIAMTRAADESDADLSIAGTLGEGGMGVVERAHQRSLQREVAVKRAQDHGPPERYAALLAEAVFTGYLEHPSIVPVHALGRDEAGRPVMVMKKIEGVTLDELLRDPSHPAFARAGGDRLGFFLDLTRRLADALAFAHSRGVVHRDLKPANVMLGRFGEAYLLDWGIATRIGERLEPDAIAGSLAYMAPEMLRPASGEIDARTDVYLLGATLHECVTGTPPHGGRTTMEVLLSIAESPPREYPGTVPEELAAILQRAMHREPTERFPTAEAFGQALARFEAHRAASDLATIAQGRLGELRERIEGAAPPAEVHAVFHECRFGFEQSAKSHPEGRVAKRGLRDALIAMTGFEIAHRNAPAAEALLARLDPPPVELSEHLDALKAELVREAEGRERLRRLEHDLDDAVGGRERSVAARIVLACLSILALALATLRFTGLFVVGPRVMAIAMIPGGLILGTVLYRWRRDFFGNHVSRQMGFTMVALFVGVATNRVTGALAGRAMAEVASGDALVVATVSAVSALTLRRVYLLPAGFFWVAALAMPAMGERSFIPLLAAAVASVVVVVAAPASLRVPLLSRPGGEKP
jgi:serine/threonine-protein kinase